MTRKPSEAQVVDALLTRYDRRVAEAFHEAMDDVRAKADFAAIIDALTRGDLGAAIDALNLDPAAYADLYEAVREAYTSGGQHGVESLPSRNPETGAVLPIRFSIGNPRAAQYLRENGAGLITRLIDDQRVAVRKAMEAGMQRGENPRTTALDIVGRINPTTGSREGGVLGLTLAQVQAVERARAELASGDPSQVRAYFERARRDKGFDWTIAKAIDAGEPVPAATIRKAMQAYERRLLQLRGEMIGRTEALRALNAGAYEAIRQAVDSGMITTAQVRRTWRSAADLRVRHTHRGLNGDTVGLEERFHSSRGAFLRFPGDPEAPAAETINCRCWVQNRVDWLANLR